MRFASHREWRNDTMMINNSARNKRASKYNKRELDRRNFEHKLWGHSKFLLITTTECGTSRHDVLIHLSKFLAATVVDSNPASRIYRLRMIFARLNIITNAAISDRFNVKF